MEKAKILFPDEVRKGQEKIKDWIYEQAKELGLSSTWVNGYPVDSELDEEALRLVKGMPKWNPGKHNGTEVRVKYSVPILFRVE